MTDSQKTSVSIAMVGCGYWGKNLVRNFHTINALGAVCDPHPETAQKFSEMYNVPALQWEDVLNSDDITAVALAVPAEMHFDMALAAMKAGKHIYVEKPLALDVVEAQKLVSFAEDKKLTLMVGHLLQYHPIFMELKKQVNNGLIGNIKYIYSNRLSLGKIRSEENVLWSFAPHDISMILSLMGEEPTKVSSFGSCALQDNVEDFSSTHLTFADGQGAHIFVSWLNPFKEQKLVVTGDNGMLVFDDTQVWEEKLAHYPHKIIMENGSFTPQKAEPIYLEVAQDEPLKNECMHFVDCVINGNAPRTDGHEGLRVLKVLDAATKSLQAGF